MTAGTQQPISAITAGHSAVTPPSTLDNGGRPAGVAKTPPCCIINRTKVVVLVDFIIKIVMPDEIGLTEYR